MLKDPLKKVKAEILRISAYELKGYPYRIKLNQNENPFEAPELIKAALARKLMQRPWGRYPDFQATELCRKLAAHAGWIPAGTTVGNGSNELLQIVLHLVLERGKKLLLVPPTFALYRILGLADAATVLEVPFEDFTRFPRDRLLETMAAEKPDAMIFCSPNNPTGTLLERDALREILELAEGIVVLDQAYYEFSECEVIDLLNSYPHLVITRTFSKAMAAAGLRLGYLLAQPDLVTQVNKVKLPYNVNFVTLAAAEALLDNSGCFKERIRQLVGERQRLYDEMGQMNGVEVFPSHANFILFRVQNAGRVFSALQQRGILIRDVSATRGLENCLRVSVGLPQENQEFVQALRESVA